jgi:hypothetical protein
VAIFVFSAKVVKRSAGCSMVAAAAYRSGEQLYDERLGKTFDYTRRQGVMHEAILTPEGAPEWMADREKLWNAVELGEKRKDAQLAREIQIALPHELTHEQRVELIEDYIRDEFTSRGMVADLAIHGPDREGDPRNYHAHVTLTMRSIEGEEFGKKCRDWNRSELLEAWREHWAEHANEALERHHHEARIDHRSLEAQGIDREAQPKLGPIVTELERRGVETARGDERREVMGRNAEREALEQEEKTYADFLTKAAAVFRAVVNDDAHPLAFKDLINEGRALFEKGEAVTEDYRFSVDAFIYKAATARSQGENLPFGDLVDESSDLSREREALPRYGGLGGMFLRADEAIARMHDDSVLYDELKDAAKAQRAFETPERLVSREDLYFEHRELMRDLARKAGLDPAEGSAGDLTQHDQSERAPRKDAGDLVAGALSGLVGKLAEMLEGMIDAPSIGEQVVAKHLAIEKHEAEEVARYVENEPGLKKDEAPTRAPGFSHETQRTIEQEVRGLIQPTPKTETPEEEVARLMAERASRRGHTARLTPKPGETAEEEAQRLMAAREVTARQRGPDR